MECEYCKNSFVSKYSLQTHQKRAKYCIAIQKQTNGIINTELVECKDCNKSYSKHNLFRHKNNCKIRFKNLSEIQAEKIIFLENRVHDLESKLNIYKEMAENNRKCIEDIARQPHIQNNSQTTNQTNQTNNLNILTPMDMKPKSFSEKIKNHFTKDYMLLGQKGVARFAAEKLLRDENGKLKYICTDPSRQIYRFKTVDGEFQRDVKAKKLTQALSNDFALHSHRIAAGINENNDPDIFVIYTRNFQDIKEMSEDNGEFRNELATLTSV
jgi:hypothetical protein